MIDDFIEVGTVQEIWRYPVKSMAGERLDAARVSWYGLDGDRRAAFVRDDNHSGFPWLTARQAPELVRYQPFYANPTQPDEAALQVKTPDGRTLPLDSAELREELAGLYGRSANGRPDPEQQRRHRLHPGNPWPHPRRRRDKTDCLN